MTKVVGLKMTLCVDRLTRTFWRRNWRGVSGTSRQVGNVARQRLRWIGRATGVWTCSAAGCCINATVSMKSDPSKSLRSPFLRVVDGDWLGGLTAAEMVKYAVSDDGKNGQF